MRNLAGAVKYKLKTFVLYRVFPLVKSIFNSWDCGARPVKVLKSKEPFLKTKLDLQVEGLSPKIRRSGNTLSSQQ